jgi:hypothetical protein
MEKEKQVKSRQGDKRIYIEYALSIAALNDINN